MRKMFLLICLIVVCQFIFAQQMITGKITDGKGAPLAGATVKVKSTKKGTSTNSEGVFKIAANPNDVLEITSIGFKSQSVTVTGSSDLTISLEASSAELADVVVTGSRGAPRVKTESPVPIDVIKVNQIGITTAKPDLMSQLNMSVPSFNYNKQSGGDGSDAIDFASLRGLGFDQTLVLVNGKRRHLSAFVNQAGTRGRGNSGTDLNAIPEASIDRIEILRDGASAQYGSDAIAGVVNIILKKDVKHLNISTGWSGYYDKKYNTLNNVDPSQYYTGSRVDGNTFNLGLDYGLPIGKNGGFINFGGNFLTQGKTFRENPDTSLSTNAKALPINGVRRAFGDGSVTTGGGMLNGEIPIAGTQTKFYFFGGYNQKLSNVYAYTRNFSGAPQKFPTNPDGTLIFVPGIMRVHTADDGSNSISSDNVYYNPQERVRIQDGSFAAGFSGTTKSNWDWNISDVIGKNNFHYFGHKTFNASLLPEANQALKTNFDDGGFSFLQNTANLDISKHFSSVAQGLTLSFGGEFRYEKYRLYKGEVDSYTNGGAFFVSGGDTTYKASGSEGYPGYQPSDEANAHRTNLGGYVDVSIDVTKDWLVEGAARFENYSDFGFVNTYKFATRYKLTSNFNLRGSISTGFRAPSLQQINFSNTNTTIVAGQLVYTKLAPNYSPITKAAGVPQLKQETATNASFGFNWKPVHNLTFTVDGYWVKMKNRIVATGNFDGAIPALAPYLVQYNVNAVNFFANAVNTTNTGVDIVIDYTKKWNRNRFTVLLAGNIQHISIDKINIPTALSGSYRNQQAFFSTREQYFLKASAPPQKFSLAVEYGIDKFSVGTHITFFGKIVTQGFGYSSIAGADPDGPGGANVSATGNGWDPYVTTDDGNSVVQENFVHKAKVATDLYLSYKVSKVVTWIAGVDNIFNVHPDLSIVPNARNASAYDSESGGPFDAVQMGFNGMRLFTKLAFNF